MDHDDPRYSDPDYDCLGELIGDEPDHGDYDSAIEESWRDEEAS